MSEQQKAWQKIAKQLQQALGCVAGAVAGWPFKGAAYRTTKLVQASFTIKEALEEAEWYAAHAESVEEFEKDRNEYAKTVEANGQP